MAYREILFRGKAAEKQVSNSVKSIDEIFPDGWVYGFYCPEMCDHPFGKVKPDPHIIATGAPDKILTGMWFEVKENTVGQYAGLTDKNGKKIFEGDIVVINTSNNCGNINGFTGIVVFHDCGFELQNIKKKIATSACGMTTSNWKSSAISTTTPNYWRHDMASITNRVNVAFTIPVEQTTAPTGGGQIRLNMRADITKTKRFFRRLQKLCKKYGYTVGEIQTTEAAK